MPLQNSGPRTLRQIYYNPGAAKDSGDLETSTKTISAGSEPGTADYSVQLTIPAPIFPEIAVLRMGVRLKVTIDSFGGGGAVLNYRLRRNGTSIATGTVSTGGGTGDKLLVCDVVNPVLGSADTYTIFFWVDMGTCIISAVQLWAAPGTTAMFYAPVLSITYTGHMQVTGYGSRIGTGVFTIQVDTTDGGGANQFLARIAPPGAGTVYLVNAGANGPVAAPNWDNIGVTRLIFADQSVATDLLGLNQFQAVLS